MPSYPCGRCRRYFRGLTPLLLSISRPVNTSGRMPGGSDFLQLPEEVCEARELMSEARERRVKAKLERMATGMTGYVIEAVSSSMYESWHGRGLVDVFKDVSELACWLRLRRSQYRVVKP